ncbi:MAG: nucleotidyltransferase family protein [Deltaproteobacteria bacterium]|nr:nucleotidyltransferase family protein [Deltaproteobacteria bacterium]MBW2418359.1 nucleotidyltransferase family protein [Deltaproteobacteria bacterium]
MARADEESGVFLSGVVLAAGFSRRMGRPKQLLPLRGRPLLQHALDAAAASCLDEIVLVLGSGAPQALEVLEFPDGTPVRVAVNEEPSAGQSSSLRLGLRSADSRAAAAAILLGDQPQMTGELIDRVATAFLTSETPVLRPVYSGPHGNLVPGHPVLLARRIWPEVETLRGEEGMRSMLARRPEWLTELPLEGEPLRDIDNWEDYREAAEAADTGD